MSPDAALADGIGDPLLMPLHDLSKNALNPPRSLSMMNEPVRIANGMTISDNLWHDSLPQSLDDDTPKQLSSGQDFFPPSGKLSMSAANGLYHEMLMLIRQLPALILQRDFCSPFVHHHVYRGSLGGMAKPLGIALARVSAHASSAKSHANDGFVDRMITQEREKLVRNFHLYTDTPETCLAALHAVSIYQILGLFGPTEGRREEFEWCGRAA